MVDDASHDASTDFLLTPDYAVKPVRLVRNDARRGVIFSRARAADLAHGRYLVFLDAHCKVEPGWLERMAEELAGIEDRGLVVPSIYRLRPGEWTLDLEKGGTDGCTISNPFLDFAWTAPLELDGRLCTCTIGGGAWMCSRQWYDRLGGLDRAMLYWGGENIDFPLRTWLAGGSCLIAPSARIGHLYNETPSAQLGDADFMYNKIRAAHNVFGEETFERVMESLLHLPGFRDAIARIHAEREELGQIKDRIELIRKRSDRWLIDTFRLPLFEPTFYYLAPRKLSLQGLKVPRPLVSVIVPVPGEGKDLELLLSSLIERTSYGNYEVVLVQAGGSADGLVFLRREPWNGHPRLRLLRCSGPLEAGALENLAAGASESEYLAFLPPGAVLLEEHWLEKLLLLAEKRPRLLLACPRTRNLGENGEPLQAEDTFDISWDWEAPMFSRERRAEPLSDAPYQALSCPDTLLFAHRDHFLELGGFDPTLHRGPRPVMDLCVAGWIAGYEVFCHPGVAFGLRRRLGPSPAESPAAALERWRDYAQVLPAVKSFNASPRASQCLARSALAGPLLRANERYLERRRRELLSRARFDDDWLFFKFGIGDPP